MPMLNCPACLTLVSVGETASPSAVTCTRCGAVFPSSNPPLDPDQVRVRREALPASGQRERAPMPQPPRRRRREPRRRAAPGILDRLAKLLWKSGLLFPLGVAVASFCMALYLSIRFEFDQAIYYVLIPPFMLSFAAHLLISGSLGVKNDEDPLAWVVFPGFAQSEGALRTRRIIFGLFGAITGLFILFIPMMPKINGRTGPAHVPNPNPPKREKPQLPQLPGPWRGR